MNCFKCGSAVADSVRFCGNCGALVADPHSSTLVLEDEGPEDQLRRLRMVFSGDYHIERELARGGMGVIYKATETGVGRAVALKLLAPEFGISGRIAERFRREARMVAELEHPDIVPVYRVGQLGGVLFIAMKYVEGRAIDEILAKQGALPVPVVINVLRAAARGLAYAHERGIIHRDIKGGNLLVDREGRVLLSDFGVALRSSDLSLTQDGTVIGTPAFMSPEQCTGKRAEPQSDQYSLGVVAFQMLSGAVPFDADTLAGYIHHHLRTPAPDVRGARDDIPEALVALIQRALSKDPGNRFPSTADMLQAIEAVPFSESDRRTSDRALRLLAAGDTVERISTRELSRISDDVTLVPGGPAPAPAPRRWWRTPTVAVWSTAGTIVAGIVGLALFDGRSSSASSPPAPADTAPPRVAAPPPVAPPPPVPSAASRPGALRVLTSPPNAQILVDGAPVGTLGSAFDVAIPPGRRRLRVRAAGYVTFDSTIEVRSGALVNLRRVELQPLGANP
jgi:serine/threonine protein kinase